MNGLDRSRRESCAVTGIAAAGRATLAGVAQRSLRSRVVVVAAEALARQGFVTPVDVCLGLGWLHQVNVDDWRHGRVDDLEYFLPVHDSRLIDLLAYLQEWASECGLQRGKAEYVSAGRGQRQLRFLSHGNPRVEAAWRARWMSADLDNRKR